MSWKIYDITGAANCIYTELDGIIASVTNLSINTRLKIASIIDSEQFEGDGNRAGWQLALDYYSHLWRADYRQIKTKDELLESIKYSARHKLSMLDLSLISRAYNIKFIVLAKPNRVNKSGIVCMNTTQAVGDDVIVLYLQGLADFSVVKNVQFSPEKAVFKQSELPEFLQREWIQTCISDHSESKDPANMLFRAAPLPAKTEAGHIVYTDTSGNLVPNPSIVRPQVTLRPAAIRERAAIKRTAAAQAEDQAPSESGYEYEPSGSEPSGSEPGPAPADISGLETTMSGLRVNQSGEEPAVSGLETAMSGLRVNQSGEDQPAIRTRITLVAKPPANRQTTLPINIPSVAPDQQETRIPTKLNLTLKAKPKPKP
jgi:hypothetical protein